MGSVCEVCVWGGGVVETSVQRNGAKGRVLGIRVLCVGLGGEGVTANMQHARTKPRTVRGTRPTGAGHVGTTKRPAVAVVQQHLPNAEGSGKDSVENNDQHHHTPRKWVAAVVGIGEAGGGGGGGRRSYGRDWGHTAPQWDSGAPRMSPQADGAACVGTFRVPCSTWPSWGSRQGRC